MSKEETYFNTIGNKINNAKKSQLFGKPCFKLNKKAFTCYFKKAMVFKLNGTFHQDALSLDGTELFDPSGKNRPMKEWVVVPFHYKERWQYFAEKAAKYILETTSK